MKKEIHIPFYSITNNKLMYLNKYALCDLPKEENIRKKILLEEGAILLKEDSNEFSFNKNKILVLEPHPDDFALSALGYINSDMDVIVLNIFSKMKLDSFTWKNNIDINEKEYEKLRIKESEVAIEQVLNYSFLSLRQKSSRIENSNLKNIKNEIISELTKLVNNNSVNILMIPMGIGKHPDHIMVYDIIMNHYMGKLDKNIKIILYPEYPYARCKKSYYDRLNEIKQKHKIKTQVINVEEKLNSIVNAVAVYRSQYDDINKNQMLAIIREDCRAIAEEYKKENISLVYYEVER